MLVIPHTLSLITTHRCTAACENCCFSCTPEKHHPSLPVERMHASIDQAKEVGTISVVVFTGGECFLLGRDLDDLVAHASANGFITRFVSNGYWATSRDRARKRLTSLVECGLHEANFSTGQSHSRWVPREYVRNGAVEAAKLDMPVVVMVEAFKGSSFDLDTFLNEDPEFLALSNEGRISVRTSPWMQFEGRETLQNPAYRALVEEGTRACDTVLRVLAVTPTEDLVACCGLPMEELDDLHLGNLRNATIAEIINNREDDFLKIWLHQQGPAKILEYAKKHIPNLEIPPNLLHVCDKCRFMYQSPEVMRLIEDNPPPEKRAIISSYLLHGLVETTMPKPRVKRIASPKGQEALEVARQYYSEASR